MRRSAFLLAAVAIAACTPSDGPTMLPGDDCLRCHGGPTGEARAAQENLPVRHATDWSLAGTVYPDAQSDANAGIEGVDVEVADANGFAFTLHSNVVGNFYSAETVAFPLQVCVAQNGTRSCMESPVPHGACNFCHTLPPRVSAEGRIAVSSPAPTGVRAR
jgi:hypothetical protein